MPRDQTLPALPRPDRLRKIRTTARRQPRTRRMREWSRLAWRYPKMCRPRHAPEVYAQANPMPLAESQLRSRAARLRCVRVAAPPPLPSTDRAPNPCIAAGRHGAAAETTEELAQKAMPRPAGPAIRSPRAARYTQEQPGRQEAAVRLEHP